MAIIKAILWIIDDTDYVILNTNERPIPKSAYHYLKEKKMIRNENSGDRYVVVITIDGLQYLDEDWDIKTKFIDGVFIDSYKRGDRYY